MRISAIIPVAGRGIRFAGKTPKQYSGLAGKPIIAHTVHTFCTMDEIDHGAVIVAKEERGNAEMILNSIAGFTEKFDIIEGGKTRQESVYNGLLHLEKMSDIIIVHDGVRPLITPQVIRATIQEAKESGACIAAVPVKDTIKKGKNNRVVQTLRREDLWQVQTPQTFRKDVLLDAHRKAAEKGIHATDEAALVEAEGYTVSIVRGDYANIKITTPEDLRIAEVLLTGKRPQ